MLTPQQETQLREAADVIAGQFFEIDAVTEACILSEDVPTEAGRIEQQDFFLLQVVQALSQNVTRLRVEHEHQLRAQG